MTKEGDILNIEDKIVLSFDICSSTAILEDLHRTESIEAWRDFLIWIKKYLVSKSKELGFNLYKFTGDGWIILFRYDCPGSVIVPFLEDFCKNFKKRFRHEIKVLLETPPDVIGVNFGMDRGKLVSFVMRDNTEYIGRAINMACRLQSAIKDKDKKPAYKALVTKPLYCHLKGDLSQYKCQEVERTLRNIASDKPVQCVKLNLLSRTRID